MVILYLFCPAPALNPCMHTRYKASPSQNLRRPPPNKLPQILPRRNAQNKPPRRIRHNCKILLLISRGLTLKESLEFFKRRLHGDERVLAALAAEAHHGFLDAVVLGDGFAG
jgi:hypothetical protein